MRRPGSRRLGLSLSLGLVLAMCATSGVAKGPSSAKEQLDFGISMAKRGLWQEALFRFRQVEKMDRNNPQALNNIAVSLEALGRFEEALEAYRTALEVSPSSRELRQNYSAFLEFYQSFEPVDEAGPQEASKEGDEAPPRAE